MISTITNSSHINKSIINYLSEKKDHKDSIDGITLFIYEQEIKNLSLLVLQAMSDLLSQGVIVESNEKPNEKLYLLSNCH